MKPAQDSTPSNPREITSVAVLGARLTWVFIGPLALLGISYAIITQGTGWMTGWDAAFGVLLLMMLLGRWVEQRSGAATTLTGEPATAQDFSRFYAVVIPAALALWIVANAIGNHLLK